MNAQVKQMPERTTPLNLVEKLIAVMSAVDHVEKAGRNQAQNYSYVRATDVARAVRTACIENRLFLSSDVIEESKWEHPTKSGGVMNYCQLSVAFTFHDADSEAKMGPFKAIGWGQDTGDKAPYKAMTGAFKYALRNSFLIPDESDPENEEKEAEVQTQPMQSVKPRAGGSWPTTIQGDILKCYVLSITEADANFGAKKVEVRYMGLNGSETGIGCFAKGELLANLRASVHKNATFKLEQTTKNGKTYTNIKDVLNAEPLEERQPGEDEGPF